MNEHAAAGHMEPQLADSDIDRILEIPLEVSVELGRKRMRIGELLALSVGSVLELGTAAGAPLSIYANNTLIARGEAVVVGERYGIRVTDIVSPRERVRRLGGETP
jgi:flagellar motor switch protein FliN/FliY